VLALGTLLVMALVALVCWREGLLTAVTRFVNVLAAGLVAFSFWEPLADLLEPRCAGYEDGLCLMGLFALTLGALRLLTHFLAPQELDYPPALQRGGGAVFGLATGYLAAGFLLCVLQTLPWSEHFLFFDPGRQGVVRAVLPPDRAWLALVQRTGADPFADTFELRYARYRRAPPGGDGPRPYRGELDQELQRGGH
jgi:hypothetical protein